MSQATPTFHSLLQPQGDSRELEAVICHRMPRSSDHWVDQYARRTASTCGRVVLAQLAEAHCHLRLFDAARNQPAQRPAVAPASASTSPACGNPRGFLQALHQSDDHVGKWMLRINADDETACGKALNLVDRWTILTSVDEHTCVGLYAFIKTLRQTEKYRLYRRVGVFTVGGDEREGRRCVTNTNMLTSRLLRTSVESMGHLARSVPVQSNVLGGFDVTRRQWPQVIQRLQRLSRRSSSSTGPRLRLATCETEVTQ